jgi:hypothetical protein
MSAIPEPQSRHEDVIRSLAADLKPVRPLQPPPVRALLWLAVVVAAGLALAAIADRPAIAARLAAAPPAPRSPWCLRPSQPSS